jgi:hypothetical protein
MSNSRVEETPSWIPRMPLDQVLEWEDIAVRVTTGPRMSSLVWVTFSFSVNAKQESKHMPVSLSYI